jgi:hypothetical protein
MLLPLLALLAAQPPQPPAAGSLMLVGGILAGVRQKHPVGGWLFFFFWQVVAGCAITVAQTDWPSFAPRKWPSLGNYFAFALSTAPRTATLFALAAIGVMLLRTYEWRWIVVLRYVLILFLVLGALSVAIDYVYFPDVIARDIASLIFPAAYSIYFFVSIRVKSVFIDRMWNRQAVRANT